MLYKFKSEQIIEADSIEEAKHKFADNSHDFAANAECKELLTKPIEAEHIGNGLYLIDNIEEIQIAVNHHENVVAYLDAWDIDKAISFLEKTNEKFHY